MDNEWQRLEEKPLPWLLEPDPAQPGVRYFALRSLLRRPEEDADVQQARAAIMASGPVPALLDAQYPEGYWVKPGGAYSPKYRSTMWQVIFLADLGADPSHERVQRGCEYLLSHSIAANGGFSLSERPVPSSVVHCLNGDLLHALHHLGFAGDPRVRSAVDWQARAITGEGDVRYYRAATCGPGFACAYNGGLPCAWGATKAMKGLLAVPPGERTPLIEAAIEAATIFLLSHDPAVADYPHADRISAAWFKFGFPLSYQCDILETAGVLVEAGYGDDPRLAHALEFIRSKQDSRGRWILERTLNGKMWADIERKGQPSKWVTLRALRVLRGAEGHPRR